MSNFNQDVAERALKRHCDAINKILETVKIAYPDACMLLDGTGHLNFLSTSEQTRFDSYDQDKVLFDAILDADGGDW